MSEENLFLDMLHEKKNMLPAIGAEKGHVSVLYERSEKTPSIAAEE